MQIGDKVIIKSHMRIEYVEIVGEWNTIWYKTCRVKEFGVNAYIFSKVISQEDVIKYLV